MHYCATCKSYSTRLRNCALSGHDILWDNIFPSRLAKKAVDEL